MLWKNLFQAVFARRIRSSWDFGDGRDVFIGMVSNTSPLLLQKL